MRSIVVLSDNHSSSPYAIIRPILLNLSGCTHMRQKSIEFGRSLLILDSHYPKSNRKEAWIVSLSSLFLNASASLSLSVVFGSLRNLKQFLFKCICLTSAPIIEKKAMEQISAVKQNEKEVVLLKSNVGYLNIFCVKTMAAPRS